VLRVIVMQYNPDSLSRTLAAQATSEGGGGGVARSEVRR